MNILKKFNISRNVLFLGLVSGLNDLASEMIYPLVPIFLTSFLGTPVAIVGLIEGIAESTSSILKLASGWLSDKFQKRKPLVASGYFISSLSKILLGFAMSWHWVLAARFIDRSGKGIRTAARDALISASSEEKTRGKSFGFHRALDTAGAVLGPLVALLIIHFYSSNLKSVFLLAFIPGFLGVILLLAAVREKTNQQKVAPQNLFNWKTLNGEFKVFLLISIIFAIGNSSDVFLILRAQNLGFSLTLTIWAYVIYNFIYSLFSTPAGILSDRIGAKKVLVIGFFIFSLVYLSFGIIKKASLLWLLFPVYGLYIAFTEGVGKAYIAQLVNPSKLGTAYGVYQMSIGFCAFFASFFAGVLWSKVGASAPFILGSALSFISALLLLFLPQKQTRLQ